MSDDFGFAPPPFKPDEALQRAASASCASSGLTERGKAVSSGAARPSLELRGRRRGAERGRPGEAPGAQQPRVADQAAATRSADAARASMRRR